jgi:valyl-tRNA synthetase
VFEAALRLLSPFMPFITEEIWQAIYDGNPPAKSIALSKYPEALLTDADVDSRTEMGLLQNLIVEVRALRKERNVPEKERVQVFLWLSEKANGIIQSNIGIVQHLAKVTELTSKPSDFMASRPGSRVGHSWVLDIVFEAAVDVSEARARLKKEIANYDKIIANSERQLNNPGFTAKAPAHIVEGLKKQLEEARKLRDKAQGDLDALPPE